MKIIESNKPVTRAIRDLNLGDCFLYEDEYYMRSTPASTCSYYIARLRDGLLTRRSGENLVHYVDAELHIK